MNASDKEPIEACAKELVTNWTEGSIPAIVERHFAPLVDKLNKIKALCQRHQHPGVVTGAHHLATAVLGIVGDE